MVRKFKRKTERGETPPDIMLSAVRKVKQDRKSIRSAAKVFNINYRTLAHYRHKMSAEDIAERSVQPSRHVGYVKNWKFSWPIM